MDFYTNVTVFGNSVLIRGIKNGERITARHKLKPTLFVPVKPQSTNHCSSLSKTLDG